MNIFGTTGQQRRAWLDRQGENALAAIQYFAGPGVPVNALAQAADMFNPVSDIGRAGSSFRAATAPGVEPWDRLGYLGATATDMASVLAPVGAAAYAGDATRGLTEGLANLTMPADDAAMRFLAEEDGAIRAWHGSPHDFDRFSLDKIGTGEGAQAYGHGLYFAESPDVATAYRDTLAAPKRTFTLGGQPFDPATLTGIEKFAYEAAANNPAKTAQQLDDMLFDSGLSDDALARAKPFLEKYAGQAGMYDTPRGRLYEVEINANPEDFLDWDAPLSAQPESVRNWFDSRGITPGFAGNQSGAELMMAENSLLGPDGVADAMRQAGVPGVRYLDHGSRFNAVDGTGPQTNTRNYVVFDDSLISILNKYGLAGLLAGGAGYGMTQEEQF